MEAEVNEHLLDQLNTLKSQASVRLRGSILIRSSFLYKSMSPCTKIKYKRGKQKHLFLPNPRAASEVTFSINLEKSMWRSKLCSDIYSTRRTLLHLETEKNQQTVTPALHLQEPSPCRWRFQLHFSEFCPLCTTQTTKHSEGFEQGGRIGQTEESWACSVWDCAEICSWSSLCAVDLLNLKPRQGFQFNLLLLKAPRKTDDGKGGKTGC